MHRYLNRKRSVVAGSGRVDSCVVESHSRSVDTNDRCPVGAEMDTYSQPVTPKRRIVEETPIEGASVARVARVHGLSASLVFIFAHLRLI
jgi:hypothetical protein